MRCTSHLCPHHAMPQVCVQFFTGYIDRGIPILAPSLVIRRYLSTCAPPPSWCVLHTMGSCGGPANLPSVQNLILSCLAQGSSSISLPAFHTAAYKRVSMACRCSRCAIPRLRRCLFPSFSALPRLNFGACATGPPFVTRGPSCDVGFGIWWHVPSRFLHLGRLVARRSCRRLRLVRLL